MKPYSITRRLVTTILLMEFILTGLITTVELLYLREQHFKTFDIMLRGRADSVFGAVQDMEDQADNVFLDTSALDVPAKDVYEVHEESGKLVGRSQNWTGLPNLISKTGTGFSQVKVNGREYRGLTLHTTRNIDLDDKGPGIPHKIVVFYAAPTHSVWHALEREAKLLALSNSLLLLLSGLMVMFLLRRGMSPLNALTAEASRISASSWNFRAPPEAFAAKELAPLATTLDLAMKRLQRSFVQQKTFVSDAAHELKTAVTIIKSSLQLLSYKDRTAAEYREGLDLCLADCGRMEDLVVKMLMLARIEAEPASRISSEAPTRLNECLGEAIAQMQPLAELRNVKIEITTAAEATTLLPKEDCMVLATNLLLNAIQHSGGGSSVVVRIDSSSQAAVGFAVEDNGAGIAADSLPYVFDRFYREDESRARNTGGAGLGLAICRAIVETRQGSISIQSEVGKGTIVTVKLPAIASTASLLIGAGTSA